MSSNSTRRFTNTAVLAVQTEDATRVVGSDDFDDALEGTYQRVGLRRGLLERLAGIRERRWWADGVTFVDGAAMAGAKAISESGVDPASIGLMVNTSVSRRYLEPSTAVAVHHALALPPSCQNFDVTNACLGFVNGMEPAAAMIDSGFIAHGLIVNGEHSRPGTEHHELCTGDNDLMRTDLKGLLNAGLDLSEQMWAAAREDFDWAQGMSRY